jgi:hypothetical protein
MFNRNPFGIVRTAPGCTITFAGAVEVDVRVQLDGMVQSPKRGKDHKKETVVPSLL